MVIHAKNLRFKPVAKSEARNVRGARAGLFGAGKKSRDEFADCIASGEAELCEVSVVSQFWLFAEDASKKDSESYGIVLETEGNKTLCADGILCVRGERFFSADEAPYDRDNAREALEEDVQRRMNAAGKKGYVLHYRLGERECYRLLAPETANEISRFVSNVEIPYKYHCLVPLK